MKGRKSRLLVAGTLVLCCLGAAGCSVAAHLLTRPHPRAIGAVPAELCGAEVWELPYRVPGDEQDSIVRAWWKEADSAGPVVVLLHGWKESRRSMVPRARFLLEHGYGVLLPDLPAHGESDGAFVTFGLREGVAVRTLVDEVRRRAPGRPVAGLGVSLGGAALLLSGCEPPLDAYVLESTFATLERAVDARLRRVLGRVGSWLEPGLESAVHSVRGFSAEDVRPLDAIATLDRPVFLIHGTADRSTPLDDALALEQAAVRAEVRTWWIEGAGHRDLSAIGGEEYRARLLDFLHSALR